MVSSENRYSEDSFSCNKLLW